jgi:cytochrome c-type biogenesis protein CcmF
MGSTIGTPSVRTGLTSDVYLTIAGNRPPEPGATEVQLEVFLKPFITWLWIGGLLMALGTVLAAFPGSRRRRPIDPVSAPVPERRPEPEVVAGG